MRVRKGWLVSINENTKKMVPFFVKVRSQDIVATDPIDITGVLKQTSTRWNLVRKEDRTDLTYYRFEANWDSKYDANAETVGSDLMDGYIDYYFYKDGRLSVDGNIRATAEYNAINDTYATIASDVYLPFAFNEIPELRTNFGLGTCSEVTVGAKVITAQITNQKLNLNSADKTEYNFLMKLVGIVPVNSTVASAVPLENLKNFAESDETYKDAAYDVYIKSYFPFHIEGKGFWKSHDETISVPKSFDESLIGTYEVSDTTNMLIDADPTSSAVCELAEHTKVVSYGKYTETKNGKFLACEYTPTQQVGYIHVDYLVKQ